MIYDLISFKQSFKFTYAKRKKLQNKEGKKKKLNIIKRRNISV